MSSSSSSLPILGKMVNNSEFSENIPFWNCDPEKPAKLLPFPEFLHPALQKALHLQGINQLYSHQREAIELINQQENVVISTGTASGKSLCYQLPIINQQLVDPNCKSLLIFPTKALANDQLMSLQALCVNLRQETSSANGLLPIIYDGDTATSYRSSIRENASILITNPDMLHLGILPHHTSWMKFFSGLKYVVLDEVHIYRGVFGSHVANVIRRLNRIAAFYGAHPHFILTSATIENPLELSSRLIDQKVQLVSEDGSPHGKKYFILYNPPIIYPDLGVRQGLIPTSLQFSEILLKQNTQTLLFARSRRTVELIVHELHKSFSSTSDLIRAYRSGYLKADRREIENGLKSGTIKLAVATNALELGVDIGGVDIVVMAGYPGTIASTRQRAGRAGRQNLPSVALMIASSSPLDQFLCRHPEFLVDRDPEKALLDPDNPLILLQHLQCAIFELPFMIGETFGSVNSDTIQLFLQILATKGVALQKNDRVIWMSQDYPAAAVSLRSTGGKTINLTVDADSSPKVIGELDYETSLWMAHPGAVYLHEGDPYLVQSLDLEGGVARIEPTHLPYFTEPVKSQKIQIDQDFNQEETQSYEIHFSELEVHTQISAYKKIDWETHEILSLEPLEMPETILRTFGIWYLIKPEVVTKMRDEKMWTSDPNDYGPTWEIQRRLTIERDQHRCTVCGLSDSVSHLHVHHKIPFRQFSNPELANDLTNLVTLCSNCHRLVELNVKIRSAISGLNYSLFHLAPLQVMCDETDLGSFADPAADFADRQPVVLIYDAIPAGMGLSQSLFQKHKQLIADAGELISSCECTDGCPSCVGPISETGSGGKKETRFLISLLLQENDNG